MYAQGMNQVSYVVKNIHFSIMFTQTSIAKTWDLLIRKFITDIRMLLSTHITSLIKRTDEF